MALPTKEKTWEYDTNNTSTYVSLLSVSKDILFGLKEFIKGMDGVTVKGSGDGSTSLMDGTDRWPSAGAIGGRVSNITTNNTSWIVLTCANMGVDIALSFVGSADNSSRIAFAPAADYALNGSQHPTCTNEQPVLGTASTGADLHPNTGSLNRFWNVARSDDGECLWWFVARAGTIANGGIIQKNNSVVVAPATYSPNVHGVAWTTASPVISALSGIALAVTRANGVNCTAYHSVEGYAAGTGPGRTTFQAELQGTAYILYNVGLWSETVGARGKLCNVIDFWAGLTTANDGDTYPADATRLFIQVGDWVLPWDGSVPVLT